jgi:hypothetical protein
MMGTLVFYLNKQQPLDGRHDKPLKFWLHNSCTIALKQRLFAQQ